MIAHVPERHRLELLAIAVVGATRIAPLSRGGPLLNFAARGADSVHYVDALAPRREAAVFARLHQAMPTDPVEQGPDRSRLDP